MKVLSPNRWTARELLHVLIIGLVVRCTLECTYVFDSAFSLQMCPGVGLLDHMVILLLVFSGNLHAVLQSGCTT